MNDIKKVSLCPSIYISNSAGHSILCTLAVLAAQIVMLFVTKSYKSLIIIGSCVGGVLLSNGITMLLRKKYYFHLSLSLTQGIIIGLLTPSSYSPLGIFFISFIVMLFISAAYHGFSDSWINPVIIAVVLAWIFDISSFPSYIITKADMLSNNPSLLLIQNGTFPTMPKDASITNFLNRHVFEMLGVSIPDGYVSLFWDTHAAIPAFRFNFITLLSSIILISFNMLDHVIPAFYIASYMLMVLFFEPLFMAMSGNGDVLLALMSSGTLFCAVFVLQWYGTTPLTLYGKICYGVLGGISAFFIVGCGTSPVGSVFTIMLLNIASLFIQQLESAISLNKMKRILSAARIGEQDK